ncbi:hypothetical protein HJC23_000884 [Cyclotella cryptica]|uniref:AP2/ERF domain-containing protein n=1 Tax=Cyclotella cryptica TaxID=29204 RepID=A0ABD3PTU8_9STRA
MQDKSTQTATSRPPGRRSHRHVGQLSTSLHPMRSRPRCRDHARHPPQFHVVPPRHPHSTRRNPPADSSTAPARRALSDNDNTNTASTDTNKSHEILGGVILGSGHHNLAQGLKPVEPFDFNGRTVNPKSSKYVGVTFRPNRVKYQARIYKGNKEFNLGLFDLSADAALAYDITHRLITEVERMVQEELAEQSNEDVQEKLPLRLSSVLDSTDASCTTRIRMELSKLNELEKCPSLPSPALNWLEENPFDYDAPNAPHAKECERLNFRHPQEYYAARQKEADEKKWSASDKVKEASSTKTKEKKSTVSCHGTYPSIPDLKALIRKEAIRVAKAVILHGGGVSVGGDETGKKKKRRKMEEREPLDWKGKVCKRKSQDISSISDSPHSDGPPGLPAVPSLPAIANIPHGNVNSNDSLATNPRECKNNEYFDTNTGIGTLASNAKDSNPLGPYGMTPFSKEDTALSSGPTDASNGVMNGMVGRSMLVWDSGGVRPRSVNGIDTPTMMSGIGMSGMGMGGMNATTINGMGVNGMNSVGMNGLVMSGMGSVGVNGMNGMGVNGLHAIGMNGMMSGMNGGMNGAGIGNMATLGMHSLNGVGMNSINAMGMHNAKSLGMNSMDQLLMAQSRTQNLLCPTSGDMNDFTQANFALNGMETSQNFNSMLNLQRNMNSFPLTTSDFMNAAMDGSLRGVSSLGGVVPGAGGNMLSNPYGPLAGNFNLNISGNLSGDGMIMGNGGTVLPSPNMMMMGASGGMDGQYGNSIAGMNCQMMLMQQRQQQLYQQTQDGINNHLNDSELNSMGENAGGVSLLNKSGMINMGIENINNKLAGSLNPYQNNFFAGPFSGVNFYPSGGAVGNAMNQPVSGDVGSLMGSSQKFFTNNGKPGTCLVC